jgi:hypothetical protein
MDIKKKKKKKRKKKVIFNRVSCDRHLHGIPIAGFNINNTATPHFVTFACTSGPV